MTSAGEAMAKAPLDMYSSGLTSGARIRVRARDGSVRQLPIDTWLACTSPGDDTVVARCIGPTLDIGCGPGRLTVAVADAGLPVLGVDLAPAAVALARARGARAECRSVFGRLPGRGRWRTILIIDGNIGIGGDPGRLLRTLVPMLAPAGQLLIELDPPGAHTGRVRLRLETGTDTVSTSSWFSWAHLAVTDIAAAASEANLSVGSVWNSHSRWFAALVPVGEPEVEEILRESA